MKRGHCSRKRGLRGCTLNSNGGPKKSKLGTDDELLQGNGLESEKQKPSSETDTETDKETSDIDLEHSMSVSSQLSPSSFYEHLGYNLSEAEVHDLSNKKWEYNSEVPEPDKLNCKWIGTGGAFLKDVDKSSIYGLKERLYAHWLDVYKQSGGDDFHSSKQKFFFSLCNSYKDILHSNKKPFYFKGVEEDSSIKDSYIIHCLNHIFFTRDLVRKNDAKVAKQQKGGQNELLHLHGFLDHGFTRPKVLILLPFRSITLWVVKRLMQLTPQAYKVNVEHVDRFYDEFGIPEEEGNLDDESSQSAGMSRSLKSSKPSDHQSLFGGNNDDNFMMGIKFTRRSIKLYGDFYSSDMIVASPIALHKRIEEATHNKEIDYDFLSSIEVLVIDHADVIAMQNWNFLSNVVEHMNRIPSKQHGTDIMRMRKWYLDENARFYRQTIILGHYVNPDVIALFNHQCPNHRGKAKLVCKYKGILSKIKQQVRQIYERFDVNSISDADDARLEFFTKKLFPKIKDSTEGGIMIFVSSYFEYVKLRNYMKSQNASFCVLADYTKQSDVSRARLWFFKGKKNIMLYTERRHFYNRYKIRGIKNLIFYSLPDRMDFYSEMVNMLQEENNNNTSCTVLFSKMDQLRLERIVGTVHARRMVTSEKTVFLLC